MTASPLLGRFGVIAGEPSPDRPCCRNNPDATFCGEEPSYGCLKLIHAAFFGSLKVYHLLDLGTILAGDGDTHGLTAGGGAAGKGSALHSTELPCQASE